MDWAEIDALLWLWVTLKLISFLVNSGIAFAQAKGWLPDSFAHGALSFTHA